jgi:hypothetical protein
LASGLRFPRESQTLNIPLSLRPGSWSAILVPHRVDDRSRQTKRTRIVTGRKEHDLYALASADLAVDRQLRHDIADALSTDVLTGQCIRDVYVVEPLQD